LTTLGLTIGELASAIGGRLTDESIAGKRAARFRSLVVAGPDDVSFYKGDPNYLPQMRATRAATVVCDAEIAGAPCPLIVVDDAALAVSFLLQAESDRQDPPPVAGIHPRAVVDPSAEIGEGVVIGPCAVIEANARISTRSRIGAGAFVGHGATLGEECVLHPGACILHNCRLGARCVLWPYAVVGRDGFGFLQRNGKHLRTPQVGGVSIGDDVELGCWSSVDRGAVDPTIVEDGVKVDSHCHIAHNCRIGEFAILTGYARLGGSATIGKRAIIAQDGAVGVGRKVGDGGIVGSGSAVLYRDVAPGETVLGCPSRPALRQKRIEASSMELPELLVEVRRLRKRVEQLEARGSGPD
jgi:UDP-3-O-[3-hydroxymyristoyl] glucosamine N-acyltransferase